MELQNELRAWRREHPKATFAEIENEVQRRLTQVHADLVTDLAAEEEATERPSCPQCQRLMHSAGMRRRWVQSRMGQQIAVERTYYVCPTCGSGLFPPG